MGMIFDVAIERGSTRTGNATLVQEEMETQTTDDPFAPTE
jgi:hypothetical protein